ncbi:MAG: hypothetical protein LC127_10050 [Chitinophagales bacterium]|nr:hypothetical protein [Chitinophagales bacterium]
MGTPTQSQTSSNSLDTSVINELKSNPNGDISGISREDLELVAMLAGRTSTEMRNTQFIDNIASTVAAKPVDPRAVLHELIKKVPTNIKSPQPVKSPVGVVQSPQPSTQNVDDGQMLLQFRQSTIEDIVLGLSSINSRLLDIERKIKSISDFIDKINDIEAK